MHEEKVYCAHCGALIEDDDYEVIDGQSVCRTCAEEDAVMCQHCGELIWAQDSYGDDYTTLCRHCFHEYYTRCTSCGCLLHEDDAYHLNGMDYCRECYEDECDRESSIHEYGYKPTPLFKGNGSRYFGVELEIDNGGKDSDYADELLEIGNRQDECIPDSAELKSTNERKAVIFSENPTLHCYILFHPAGEIMKHEKNSETLCDCVAFQRFAIYELCGIRCIYIKSDGSLDDGMEIVTHPMTLDYHKDFCWEELMQRAVSLGYRSHQTSTCGLHIHVNRSSLGRDTPEQEETISRILYFTEHHWNEMLKFSRRSEYSMNRWAARYGYESSPKAILDKAKKGNCGRYAAVNLCNCATIEFRMFRGTLKYNTMIAAIELVNQICEYAQRLTDYELERLSWSDFVSDIKEPELIQYLKERRLYINEIITAQEDA